MDAQMLSQILGELLQPNTERVKAATDTLNKFMTKNPLCIGSFMEQIQSNPDPGVRQMAAVVLRRCTTKYWGKLDEPSRATVQQALLTVLQSEGTKPVRRSVVALTAAVGHKCFANPATRWMDLLQFINSCCSAPQEDAREMGYMLLEHLAPSIGMNMKDLVASLVVVLGTGLQDGNAVVQSAALRATGNIMQSLSTEDEILQFSSMIPQMLAVLGARVAEGEEDVTKEVLEVLDELAQTPYPILNDHVPNLMEFLLQMVKAENIDGSVRDLAAVVMCTLCEFKPKLVGKRQLVPNIVQGMLHVIASSNEQAAGTLPQSMADNMHDPADGAADDSDDESDDGEGSMSSIAQSTLDKLASTMPMKYVWAPALEACLQCLQSGESNYRKAGASALGNLAEGCQDPMRENLENILPLILQATTDPNNFTREAACFCLGQMGEHCQPEIMRYQEHILPVVFERLGDERQGVQGISCYVLETFCKFFTREMVQPALETLTRQLVTLANSPRLSIREMSLSALSEVVSAAEEDFRPYAPEVMTEIARGPLQLTEERHWTIRGRALECVGNIAIAIGKEHFEPFMQLSMQCAEQSLQIPNSSELAEYVYSFFGNVSSVMGHDFAPFLDQLCPHLIDIVSRRDHEETSIRSLQGGNPNNVEAMLGATLDDDDDDDDDDEGGSYLQVRVADLDAKRTAIVGLGMLGEFTGPAFREKGFLDKSFRALFGLREYFHSSIREEVVLATARLVRGCITSRFGDINAFPKPEPGAAIVPLNQIDPTIAAIADAAVRMTVECMNEDDNKVVVAHATGALDTLVRALGPACLAPVMSQGWLLDPNDPNEVAEQQQQQLAGNNQQTSQRPGVMEIVLGLLYEKGTCQITMQDVVKRMASEGEFGDSVRQAAEIDNDEEEADHDNVLMDQVADLVGSLAKVFGPSFSNYSQEFVHAMMKFAKANRPASDRAMAIGTFAEITEHMGAAAAPHIPDMLPVVKAGLSDAHPGLKRNSAFAAGMLALHNPTVVTPHFTEILGALAPLFELTHDADAELKDNAVSAVGRLLLANISAVPTEQVVPPFLAGLPLRKDESENENVYTVVAALLEAKHPHMLPVLPSALVAVAHCLNAGQDKKVSDALKARVAQALKGLFADPQHTSTATAALQQVSAEDTALGGFLHQVLQ